ncbi:Rne/Rng family ribonuclease [Fredinandcohnia quinoae]|uniref:Rne/Rng family ribonuclease n=1 Tax=Fredinandcohnia quinoae TaxID=2918902 RepID=A0AAW5E950_9BACI|nr:Rne/Rng family ribonuclease [Fredinandcohnia sp. SECRCQ15]MCH1626556.1 Rne/Rng family ribonuclease [Fredinandcohnia sp. SECRCQ15]
MKKVIMNVTTSEKRIAVMENNEVIELHLHQPMHEDIVGNIYSGRVIDVLPGMQAAFIDIGFGKNGFIHRDQLLEYQQSSLPEKEKKSISSFVRQGEEIIVQVTKEGSDRKGPRLTGIIEIPGSYLVYVPNGDYVAVSRKMKLEEERERWREIGETYRRSREGLIIRTVCEKQDDQVILEELKYLRQKYESILARQKQQKPPSILYEANDIVERIFAEQSNEKLVEIVVDDSLVYRQIKERLGEHEERVSLFVNKENIFSFYGIDNEIEKALKHIVWLDNGAYLLIEQTEALTVIDVNTGKFQGKENLRDTVLRTNILAAKEIAYQLKLRDLSGIVLVDFIDMKDEGDKQKVIQAFKRASTNDRNRIRILGFTKLGILELTRKKLRQNISELVQMNCPVCSGTGRVGSPETIAFKLERELWELRGMDHEAVWIEATKDVSTVFKGKSNEHTERLEKTLLFKIHITELESPIPSYLVRHFGMNAEIVERIQSIKK